MPNTFGTAASNIGVLGNTGPWLSVVALVLIAVVVIAAIYLFVLGKGREGCPTELRRKENGTLELYPTGQVFGDMNAFQQWWASSGHLQSCPLPRRTGAKEVPVLRTEQPLPEETYAATPLFKVDDYEFSRVFGVERNGRMMEDREDYNKILMGRQTDWVEKPLTSDDRRGKYQGLTEGFSAAGVLTSASLELPRVASTAAGDLTTAEVVSRFGERRPGDSTDPDVSCKIDREAKKVARMVADTYANDPDWEPVVTKVGPHHWEVNELKPRSRRGAPGPAVEERVVDTANDAVDVRFRYREQQITDAALDPYFAGYPSPTPDPYQGTVPGMERMFGPTLDRERWY
jgi:hypothetical protein